MAGDEGRSIRMSESETELRKKSRCQGRIGRLERAGESGRMRRTGRSGCANGRQEAVEEGLLGGACL